MEISILVDGKFLPEVDIIHSPTGRKWKFLYLLSSQNYGTYQRESNRYEMKWFYCFKLVFFPWLLLNLSTSSHLFHFHISISVNVFSNLLPIFIWGYPFLFWNSFLVIWLRSLTMYFFAIIISESVTCLFCSEYLLMDSNIHWVVIQFIQFSLFDLYFSILLKES